MEKDIFAPKELSQKLKEIGFDEPCIAYFHLHSILKIIPYSHNFNGNQSIDTNLSAPPLGSKYSSGLGRKDIFHRNVM